MFAWRSGCRGHENHCVAASYYNRGIGLFGDFAGFDADDFVADLLFNFYYI
jgi:hypothetical protein